jgi:two-component system response regulator NreC
LRELIAVHPGLRVVGEADSALAAFGKIRASAPPPELVLMDLQLPGEGGVAVTRRLLAEFPAVRIIALSGDTELELLLDALYAGVSGYILKNDGVDELFRAIHAVMDQQLYLSPKVATAAIRNFMKSFTRRKPAPPGTVLSDRERLLLRLVAEGRRNKEIAGDMAVTAKSVETYRFRLMKKLGFASTAELIRYAIREGIVQA